MKRIDDCQFNSMVECQPGGRNCSFCGWNPAVRKKREAQMKRSLNKPKEVQENA